jgi:hypothetical protein
LIRSYNIALSAQEAEDVLFGAAQNLGNSNYFGHGLVDVEQSLIDGGGGSVYDLVLIVGPLTAGSTGTAAVTGSSLGNAVQLFNGSGLGSSTIPGLGVDLDIDNARKVAQGAANASGLAMISRNLPARLSGLTVFLQAADTGGRISNIVTDTIL